MSIERKRRENGIEIMETNKEEGKKEEERLGTNKEEGEKEE